MGFWDWLTGKKKEPFAPQRVSVAPRTAPPRRMTVEQLARELFAEHPDGIETELLWERCEQEDLSMADVDRRIDDLRLEAQRTVETLKPRNIIDLSHLESVRMRVKGQAHWVTVAEREKFSRGDFWLVREPRNEYDKNAVAVFGGGRKLGYVSAARAAMVAPLLDEFEGDAFKVGGVGVGDQGIRMWVDVPKVPALRAFSRAGAV